ncbi:trehalase-like domain-containing protein [Arthrobacter gengyunqii]|uniref:DUF5911 domain-containing protein n=1 Tax=Arthrobacter gengyunqii TaxID=2886940 RepID=A0ABS8GM40_9MICC|nr:trehalase-like domain-containing protein [Arthrobacter gengyunqii]MCC3267734.1 DUF5911 domain-containing protein [Arthrobacter gengyunqii]
MTAESPTTTGPDERINGYADLRSYAAIGDGRTVALVARDGAVDWYPTPDLDSVPSFAALLDADDGGRIELRPEESFTSWCRWRTTSGSSPK